MKRNRDDLHKLYACFDGHAYVLLLDGTLESINMGLEAIDRWVQDPQLPLNKLQASVMRLAILNPPFKVQA